MLIDDLKNDSIFHTISWSSRKSKRPLESVPSPEILVASEGIDDEKQVVAAYREIGDLEIKLQLCIDSKELFNTLSIQRNSINKSVRGDVSSIRIELMTGAVDKITWIPGKSDISDVLTKRDSLITETMQLTLHSGKLSVNLDDVAQTKISEKNFG